MFWAAAASWYGKAAEHGDAFAQDRLAFQLAITASSPMAGTYVRQLIW
jgi:hypothetical protein